MDELPWWPLFDVAVRTPRLELRMVSPALLHDVVALEADGIHDPATMPFIEPWTDEPSPGLERSSLRHFWRQWATLAPDDWVLSFAVVVDGEVHGLQGMRAKAFPAVRSFDTGSWLGRAHQGRGTGTEMRAAILHFGFVGLGAVQATSGAFPDNAASMAVSTKLGYEPNGVERVLRRDEPTDVLHLRLTRERWEARRRDDIEIVGLTDDALGQLGL